MLLKTDFPRNWPPPPHRRNSPLASLRRHRLASQHLRRRLRSSRHAPLLHAGPTHPLDPLPCCSWASCSRPAWPRPPSEPTSLEGASVCRFSRPAHSSGLAHLFGPTGGYLLAYPLAAAADFLLWRRGGRGFSRPCLAPPPATSQFSSAAPLAGSPHPRLGSNRPRPRRTALPARRRTQSGRSRRHCRRLPDACGQAANP